MRDAIFRLNQRKEIAVRVTIDLDLIIIAYYLCFWYNIDNSNGGEVVAKRIFIAFASEDKYARDFLVGQARGKNSPFEFVDMSVKEPYETEWREKVATRIRGCNGVVAILSKNSLQATGQIYEIKTAIAEGKPLLGVYAQKTDKSKPDAMTDYACIEWSWDGIAGFINSL